MVLEKVSLQCLENKMLPNDNKKTYKMVLKGIEFFWEIAIPCIPLLSYLSVSNKKGAYEDLEMYSCACICVEV